MCSRRVRWVTWGDRDGTRHRPRRQTIRHHVFPLLLFLTLACLVPSVIATRPERNLQPGGRQFTALVEIEDMDLDLAGVGKEGLDDGSGSETQDAKMPKNKEERMAFETQLNKLEERLYGASSLGDRNVDLAFHDLLRFVENAPSPQDARQTVTDAARRSDATGWAAHDAEVSVYEASIRDAATAEAAYVAALQNAKGPLNVYFGSAILEPLKLTPLNDGTGGVSVEFGFVEMLTQTVSDRSNPPGDANEKTKITERERDLRLVKSTAERERKGARLLEKLAFNNGFDTSDIQGYDPVPDPPVDDAPGPRDLGFDLDPETNVNDELNAAAFVLGIAVEAAAAAAAARSLAASLKKPAPKKLVASMDDLPPDWRATADALFLLASVLEAGLGPDSERAYPTPSLDIEKGVPTEPWAGVSLVDAESYSTSSDLVTPTHPAFTNPKVWADTAIFVAAEMGSREARLAAGDRLVFGRGGGEVFFPEGSLDESGNKYDLITDGFGDSGVGRCELAVRVYLLPVAEALADQAESRGDVRVPSEPPRLRDRDRDAKYVDDPFDVDDGEAQIEMELDMAARGVPEAERHLGYRALVGRGVPRDEQLALRRFENAAENGDALAVFNLGYMHMKGVATPKNYTKARQLFERAAENDVAAAHNGIGVLDYNGWGIAGDGDRSGDSTNGKGVGDTVRDSVDGNTVDGNTVDGNTMDGNNINGNADAPQNAAVPNVTAARVRFEKGAESGDADSLYNLASLHQQGAGGLLLDEAEAYDRFVAAADSGHWRAPLQVAKAKLDGWTGVTKNCWEASRGLRSFIDERLAVLFPDEHEDALGALEGGWVVVADDSNDLAGDDSKNPLDSKDPLNGNPTYTGPDPWSALVRYAIVAERGGETGLANLAWLAKKRGVHHRFNSGGEFWDFSSVFGFGFGFGRGGSSVSRTHELPKHLTRHKARAVAVGLLTRLIKMGEQEARVDLGDVLWACLVENGDESLEGGFSKKFDEGEKTTLPSAPSGAPAFVEESLMVPPKPPVLVPGTGQDTSSNNSTGSENDGLPPPRSPGPPTPPPGSDRFGEILYHYKEASASGIPEGSVSVAWAHFRGIGSVKSSEQAEMYLWRAVEDSVDEIESFVPASAVVALKAVKFFGGALGVSAFELVRWFDLGFGRTEVNAVLYPTVKDHHGTEQHQHKVIPKRPGGTKKKRSSPIRLRGEDCVLLVLAFFLAALGFVRLVGLSGENGHANAIFFNEVPPLVVLGFVGAVAVAAWVAAEAGV